MAFPGWSEATVRPRLKSQGSWRDGGSDISSVDEDQVELLLEEVELGEEPAAETVDQLFEEDLAESNRKLTPEERGRKIAPLLRASEALSKGPFRLSQEEIDASRANFSRMRALIEDGQTEEARRIWWWPKNEDPPKKHYFDTDRNCSCRPASAGVRGHDGLCRHCSGHIEE